MRMKKKKLPAISVNKIIFKGPVIVLFFFIFIYVCYIHIQLKACGEKKRKVFKEGEQKKKNEKKQNNNTKIDS